MHAPLKQLFGNPGFGYEQPHEDDDRQKPAKERIRRVVRSYLLAGVRLLISNDRKTAVVGAASCRTILCARCWNDGSSNSMPFVSG